MAIKIPSTPPTSSVATHTSFALRTLCVSSIALSVISFSLLSVIYSDESDVVVLPLSAAITIVSLVLATCKCCRFVPPGSHLVVTTWTGHAVALPSGFSFILGSPFSTNPWRGLVKSTDPQRWPGVGALLLLDPPSFQMQTREGIRADVDLSLECRVLPWEQDLVGILSDEASVKDRCTALVNRWLSLQLSNVPADDLTYSKVYERLNSIEAIETLNEQMMPLHIEASCVFVDPKGVSLDVQYTKQRSEYHLLQQKQRAEEDVLQKEAHLQRLRQQNIASEQAFEREQELKQVEATYQKEVTRAKSVADVEKLKLKTWTEKVEADAARTEMLSKAGLLPDQIAALMLAEVNADALRNASGTIVLPQSLANSGNGLGLLALDGGKMRAAGAGTA